MYTVTHVQGVYIMTFVLLGEAEFPVLKQHKENKIRKVIFKKSKQTNNSKSWPKVLLKQKITSPAVPDLRG